MISGSEAVVSDTGLRPGILESVLARINAVSTVPEMNEALAELDRPGACGMFDPTFEMGRGILLARLGRQQEAIDALEAVAVLTQEAVFPMRWLAGILSRSSHVVQTESVLRRTCRLDPANMLIRNDHAVTLMRLHKHAEARSILLDTLGHIGPDISVLCNLANTAVCLGDQDGALTTALEALDLSPSTLLARRALCNVLPYHPAVSGKAQLQAMRACAAALPRNPQPSFDNIPEPRRPLVIGLLSGTLRSHPVGWLTVAAFEALDPGSFKLVCLTQNTAPEDPITRRYQRISTNWVEIGHLSDAELARTARDHAIDILIDLGGYGDAGRMAACANRLAPVQIKWVGMQAHSSGLPEMDWFLTDRWETPEGFDGLYSERLLRMPDGYVCYSPPPHAPDVASLPALERGCITFGCFNNLAKITPVVLEAWAEILRRLPTARLILKTHQLSDPATAHRLHQSLTALGIDGSRFELRGSSGHRALMANYNDVDVILDPFPYSGGLTTCEALWMGVPVVALPGEIFASRHSASHLANIGLADWVCDSVSEYIDLAVTRASDLDGLAALRDSLRERMRRSPLCDAPRFGRAFGTALRQAWYTWCQQADL